MASQLEQIAGLYGAIDRELVADRSRVEEVAQLLGGYRFKGTVGWFDGSASYVAERTFGEGDLRRLVPPDVDTAISGLELAHFEDPRLQARMFLALAAAIAADREVGARGRRADVMRRALVPLVERRAVVEPTELEELAKTRRVLRLHDILTFELRSMDQWETFARIVAEEGYADETYVTRAAFKPCFGDLVTVDLGDDVDPVPCISTTAYPENISYEDAKAHLQPANWPAAAPFWCLMQEVRRSSLDNPIFHEIVSLDCQDKQSTWTVETELEFAFVESGRKATSSYCLPDDIDFTIYPDILVDEGSLSVEELADGRICVTSSKRVKFAEPFDGTWLPMLACAFGYGTSGTELVAEAARQKREPNSKSVPFVGKQPPGGTTMPEKTGAKKSTGTKSGGPTEGTAGVEDLGKLITDSTAVIQKCVDDSVVQFKASYQKIVDNKYTANDWIGDITNLWKVMARDSALVVDYGIKASQTLAEKAKDLVVDDEDDIEKPVKKAPGAKKVVPGKKETRRPAGPVRKGPIR